MSALELNCVFPQRFSVSAAAGETLDRMVCGRVNSSTVPEPIAPTDALILKICENLVGRSPVWTLSIVAAMHFTAPRATDLLSGDTCPVSVDLAVIAINLATDRGRIRGRPGGRMMCGGAKRKSCLPRFGHTPTSRCGDGWRPLSDFV
jgi:hypothetical protein